MSTDTTDTDRAFVLGLDGVPWYLIEDWVADGELPNFARLVSEGVAGPLESTMPPTTALAWPTIASGTWADEHGVYSFRGVESDYTNEMNTARDVRQPRLWDLLSPAVVGNVPMTYPAKEIDGAMVAGMMSPGVDEHFTHPTGLADEITDEIPDYRIGLPWEEYHGEQEAFLDALDGLVDDRRALLRKLLAEGTAAGRDEADEASGDQAPGDERPGDDWRLFFFVLTAPDRLQHLVWDRTVLLDHYRDVDDALGEVLDHVEERDANLFVVSDHGFGPVDTVVHVNTFLEREGYLERKAGSGRGALERLGLTKERVRGLIDAVGIDENRLYDSLPDEFVESMAESVPGSHELYDVDFSETVAFVHGEGVLYVNDAERFENGIVAADDVPAVKNEITARLEGLTDPATGESVLSVHDGDDLFADDPDSPDLVVRAAEDDGYLVGTALTDSVFRESDMDASHRTDGIFLAWGPSISDGDDLPADADVADVAPTVLHSVGEPVPASVDGDVLSSVFAAGSVPAERPVETRTLEGAVAPAAAGATADAGDDVAAEGAEAGDATEGEDFDEVESRLQGLGYME